VLTRRQKLSAFLQLLFFGVIARYSNKAIPFSAFGAGYTCSLYFILEQTLL